MTLADAMVRPFPVRGSVYSGRPIGTVKLSLLQASVDAPGLSAADVEAIRLVIDAREKDFLEAMKGGTRTKTARNKR
jgi:hypothetical protein